LVELRRNEAADAAVRRQAAESQAKEAAEAARRQAEIEEERQHKETAEFARRRAEQADEQRRKEEMERIAAAAEADRKALAETEARRAEEERRRIASREPDEPSDDAARLKAEAIVKSAADREALTRNLQTALNRAGCYRGEIDGQWGAQGRAALAQFAKLTKHELAVDEPSPTALEVVAARADRVCPLECDGDKTERNGKCIEKAKPAKKEPVAKSQRNPEGPPRQRNAQPRTAPSHAARTDEVSSSGGGGGRGRGHGRGRYHAPLICPTPCPKG
jgi:hypothetical protein